MADIEVLRSLLGDISPGKPFKMWTIGDDKGAVIAIRSLDEPGLYLGLTPPTDDPRKLARDSRTGQFTTAADAQARPGETTVETVGEVERLRADRAQAERYAAQIETLHDRVVAEPDAARAKVQRVEALLTSDRWQHYVPTEAIRGALADRTDTPEETR